MHRYARLSLLEAIRGETTILNFRHRLAHHELASEIQWHERSTHIGADGGFGTGTYDHDYDGHESVVAQIEQLLHNKEEVVHHDAGHTGSRSALSGPKIP